MKILKPAWVSHDGNPIFAVDIHPDGTRFATGGQGPDKCGRVIIWNMAPILSEKAEHKDDVPKKLCQMDNHLACINCVRWSNKGTYLASAGDDKSLMIWQLAGKINHHSSHHHQTQSNVFEGTNIEQWRCIATLNGHNGDILDLSWSFDDQYLASCSVDNMIIVWDASNFPQVVTKICGHTGLVKGVAWDPVGKYLASQSDDKTLKIWKTSDWKSETVIKGPFRECGGTTHVLRLNWSPDGQTLVSAHAMNNSGSVAKLIERDGWKTQRDLVGHRKAVTCVRFNPNIFYQTKSKKHSQPTTEKHSNGGNTANASFNANSIGNADAIANDSAHNPNATSNGTASKTKNKPTATSTGKTVKYCCMAVGSRDKSISVWLTYQPRPLIVVHDLFDSSVLDISWSRDGCRLIACSQDGTVAVMLFAPSELGQKLSDDEKQVHLQKLYGKYITSPQVSKKTIIVEEPELMKGTPVLDREQRHREMLDQQNSHSNSVSQNGFNGYESNTSVSGMSKGPTDRQIETLLPGGKRRITPLYIQPPLPFNSTSSITFSSSKESKTKILIETTTSASAPTPTPSYTPTTTPVKASVSNSAVATAKPLAVIPSIKRELFVGKTSHQTLPPSKLDKGTVYKTKDREGRDVCLEAENDISNNDKFYELRLLDEGNKKIWDVLLANKINSVIATQMLAAASCLDATLHIFELNNGRRLVPPIVLDSPIAHIAAENDHLLVITSSASMWLWNVSTKKALIKSETLTSILSSINPVIDKPVKAQSKTTSGANTGTANKGGDEATQNESHVDILSCSLTEHYQPLILLSTGKAYMFDLNLNTWLLLSDSNDTVYRWSSCKPSLSSMKRFLTRKKVDSSSGSNSLKRSLPLTSLQSQHSFEVKRFASLLGKVGVDGLQVKATRSYLDQQVAAALAIRSAHEYHYWLMQSVQHCVDTGAESRIKELCSRLISETYSSSAEAGEDSSGRDKNNSSETNFHILGLSKRNLLREMIAILSTDLRYQRLYSEYKQLLDYDGSCLYSE